MTEFQILLDLDGVLVDFIRGIIEIHDLRVSTEELYQYHLGSPDVTEIVQMSPPAFWKPCDFEFWSKLEWMPDGQEILTYVEQRFGRESITLWTSPSLNYGCIEGKLRWVERHLPRYYKHNVIFGSKKHLGARPDTILIDDSDVNEIKFLERGGKCAKPPRIWNSLYHDRNNVMLSLVEQLDSIERGS